MQVADPISSEVRRQAIAWFVRLSSGAATEGDHRDCAHWRQAHPQHERAWTQLQSVRQVVQATPASIAIPALKAAAMSRRRVLKCTAALAAAGTGAWAMQRAQPWAPYLADHRTRVGERREIPLEDGSRLFLNTDSAVEYAFDGEVRLLRLLRGELALVTGHSPGEHRPLHVRTAEGDIEPLGTRFVVRQLAARTRVDVLEHAVRVRALASGQSWHLTNGEGIDFDAQGSPAGPRAATVADAWTRGQFVADDLPLGEVIAELARHRRGVLRCAPEVAAIRVSGVLPVDDPDRALSVLAQRFPIRIRERSRLWVTVHARR